MDKSFHHVLSSNSGIARIMRMVCIATRARRELIGFLKKWVSIK
jgi:hypothetical protein